MSAQLLNTTLKQFYDSHPRDCECFACLCHRAAIEQLGGRCPQHKVVRTVCRCRAIEEPRT